MQVTLSAVNFDPLGVVEIDTLPNQVIPESRRRMNRVATLDGGAVFNDFGFTDTDQNIKLRWQARRKQDAAIQRLVQLYARVHVATPHGFYLAALELYVPGVQESNLSLLVVAKLG